MQIHPSTPLFGPGCPLHIQHLLSLTIPWFGHVLSHSVVSDSFATLWTVACQTPLSMGFSRQEYWSGSPFCIAGDFSNPGMESTSLAYIILTAVFFTTVPPGKPSVWPTPAHFSTLSLQVMSLKKLSPIPCLLVDKRSGFLYLGPCDFHCLPD